MRSKRQQCRWTLVPLIFENHVTTSPIRRKRSYQFITLTICEIEMRCKLAICQSTEQELFLTLMVHFVFSNLYFSTVQLCVLRRPYPLLAQVPPDLPQRGQLRVPRDRHPNAQPAKCALARPGNHFPFYRRRREPDLSQGRRGITGEFSKGVFI